MANPVPPVADPATRTQPRPISRVRVWIFTIAMLLLAVVCLWLGSWQMQRLAEKEALVAAVDQRLTATPIEVPAAATWDRLDLDALNFQPVTLRGTFRYSQTVTVFASLTQAKGRASGLGYWVVTPFVLTNGGSVFVNRGFVPEDVQEAAVTDTDTEGTEVSITGLLRPAERASFMTPGADTSNRIEWVRDPARLAQMVDPGLAPFAPFYVDLPAGPPGELPQGGETVIEFPNNHLGYALTWYGFAIVAVVMLGFWLWRQRAIGKV